MGEGVKPRLLIGCVGDRFMPGVKSSIAEAAACCKEHGIEAEVKIQPPITILSYFGLATMRNRLCMRAVKEKFDFVVLLDNDVLLNNPHIFCQMTALNLPVLVPQFYQDYVPQVKVQELNPSRDRTRNEIEWSVFSCIMFNGSFLSSNHRPFIETLCYLEEETTFEDWHLKAWRTWQDRYSSVTLLRPPTNLWELTPDQLLRIQTPGDVRRETIK